MSQTMRPSADVTLTNIQGGTFADIDEASPSDTDFIATNAVEDGMPARYECKLSAPGGGAPGFGTYTCSYRVGNDGSGGNKIDLVFSVVEGTTVRATETRSDFTRADTTYTFTPDLSAIGDWSDVRFRFDFTSIDHVVAFIDWAALDVPDPGGGGAMLMFE